MTRTTSTLALVALAAPVLAYAGGWSDIPVNIWLGEEVAWAEPLHPDALPVTEIMETYDAPPRAEWCGPTGIMSNPSQSQCSDYAQDVEDWLLDFTGETSNSQLPSYDLPPTFCGGC